MKAAMDRGKQGKPGVKGVVTPHRLEEDRQREDQAGLAHGHDAGDGGSRDELAVAEDLRETRGVQQTLSTRLSQRKNPTRMIMPRIME